jgi:hypothetical protein
MRLTAKINWERVLLAGALCAGLAVPLAAQSGEPVGLLLAAGSNSKIIRHEAGTPGPASVGEMLFAGDRLLTGSSPASYLYCPARSSQTLAPNSEAVFASGQVQVAKGKITSQKEVAVCFLPRTVALNTASQQKVGALVMRGVPLPLKLISPVGSPVLDAPPRFFWQPVARADSYEIQVSNSENQLLWKIRHKGTEIQYPAYAPPLMAPSTYSWKVTAFEGDRALAATESKFELLTIAEARKIRQELAETNAASSEPALLVARAAVLEQAKLTAEALLTYEAAAKVWKDAPWLQAKVNELELTLQSAQHNVAPE